MLQGIRKSAKRRPTAISTEDASTPGKGIGGARREVIFLVPNGELRRIMRHCEAY
jgi:hypothetical protein